MAIVETCLAHAALHGARRDSILPVQQPRQMVFSLASNFEFSTASISTTCP
jgi:hypothetical protein